MKRPGRQSKDAIYEQFARIGAPWGYRSRSAIEVKRDGPFVQAIVTDEENDQ